MARGGTSDGARKSAGAGKSGGANDARAKLLAAAESLFYRNGLRAIGISELIERAGVARMALYYHFRSKDELIVEFLRQRHERFMAALRESIDAHAAPRDRLMGVFDALERLASRADFRGCAFVNAAIELPDRSHPARAVVDMHKRDVRSLLGELARAAGLRDGADVAEQLAVLMDGALVAAVHRGSASPIASARRAAMAVIAAHAVAGESRARRGPGPFRRVRA